MCAIHDFLAVKIKQGGQKSCHFDFKNKFYIQVRRSSAEICKIITVKFFSLLKHANRKDSRLACDEVLSKEMKRNFNTRESVCHISEDNVEVGSKIIELANIISPIVSHRLCST